ncbi:histidine phosphatase family protein [Acutalibacter sp. 1XD8-36]|uniref:histidine phosphatase family protein n=1 Tax=Acutalibacter sp. 1XD8-36 TaxID=2320852 RepID=UPI002626BEF0|nr:histidine phosphatase family protein [Acutalibacter sp. 1XD8-36]
MKRIITIQHCQSEQHINGMMGGWNDWELTELGREQARRIGERLGAELEGQSVKLYSSDLKRASQTAAPLAEKLGIKVEYRQELREFNGGPLVMGKSKAWYREHCDNFGDKVDERPMPGAETKRDVYERIMPLCREVQERAEDTVIFVSHGGALSVWNIVWLGLPPEVMNTCGIFGRAGAIGEFDVYRGWEHRILRIGDLSYIRD